MVKIAMIGCGDISGIYLKNLTWTFKEVELAGVCYLRPEREGWSPIESMPASGPSARNARSIMLRTRSKKVPR